MDAPLGGVHSSSAAVLVFAVVLVPVLIGLILGLVFVFVLVLVLILVLVIHFEILQLILTALPLQ